MAEPNAETVSCEKTASRTPSCYRCLTLLVVVVHEVNVKPQHVEKCVAKGESNGLLVLDVKAWVERNFFV